MHKYTAESGEQVNEKVALTSLRSPETLILKAFHDFGTSLLTSLPTSLPTSLHPYGGVIQSFAQNRDLFLYNLESPLLLFFLFLQPKSSCYYLYEKVSFIHLHFSNCHFLRTAKGACFCFRNAGSCRHCHVSGEPSRVRC